MVEHEAGCECPHCMDKYKERYLMQREYRCADCGIKITIESRNEDDLPGEDETLLCQRCDPAFSSLLDNKHHKEQPHGA